MEDNILLLANCFHIATFNDSMDELKGQDILIEGNRIKEIGEGIELSTEEINGGNSLIGLPIYIQSG
jgi:dihydroorotase-like cyclic amidohydrolase